MERFKELYVLAEQVGMLASIQEYEKRAQDLSAREKTGAIITGSTNCGKTVIMNGIVGVPLREPSMLSEEEKPLRVMFEKSEDSQQFECHVVANKLWNDEDVILYEMKLDDIFNGEYHPTQLLDLADVVYYVVSAITPFTSEDVKAIQALSFMPVKVVISKLDLVDEAAREKIAAYASNVCESLHINKPYIIDRHDWDAAGKYFRYELPTVAERIEMRRNRTEYLLMSASEAIAKEAEKKLDAMKATEKNSQEELLKRQVAVDEEKSLWRKLRTDLKAYGYELSDLISGKISEKKETVVNSLMKEGLDTQFADTWSQKIPEKMTWWMKEIGKAMCDEIEAIAQTDCKKILDRAAAMDLKIDLSYAELEEIDYSEAYTRKEPIKSSGVVPAIKGTGDLKYLWSGGIAAGAMCILPVSTPIATVGAAVAVGVGAALYLKDRKEELEKSWKKTLTAYVESNLKSLSSFFAEQIKLYYQKVSKEIECREIYESIECSTLGNEEQREKLNRIIEQCRTF